MVLVTIWLSLIFYASAITVHFLVEDAVKREKTYRILWRAGCLSAVIHVLCAFHFEHQWEHQTAVNHTIEETKRVTGFTFAYGIYFNYLFLLIWTIDCFSSANHSRWSRFVHGYMLLIIISATIVFEDGPIRYISLATGMTLTLLWLRRRKAGEQLDSWVS